MNKTPDNEGFHIGKKKKISYNFSAFKSNLDAGKSIFRQVKKIKQDYSDFPDHAGLSSFQKRKILDNSIASRIFLENDQGNVKPKGNNLSSGVGELLK